MKTHEIKSIVVLLYDDEKLTDDGYDISDIMGDSVQFYYDKVFVTCYDPENDGIKDILDKPIHLRIDMGDGKIDFKAKCHLFTPEIPMSEFGLRPQLVFERL